MGGSFPVCPETDRAGPSLSPEIARSTTDPGPDKQPAVMQIAERRGGSWAFQPTVSDELPYHCAILLLNPCPTVLFVSPRPGHLDAAFTAVGEHGFVDEGAIVIHVQPEDGSEACGGFHRQSALPAFVGAPPWRLLRVSPLAAQYTW
jgi:hypothetical protein